MNSKLLSLLGLCRRAGRLRLGFEQTLQAVEQRTAALILIAGDVAARTEKEVRFKAGDSVAIRRIAPTREQLSHAVGAPAGTVTVTDEGFAKQALLLINQEETTYDDD